MASGSGPYYPVNVYRGCEIVEAGLTSSQSGTPQVALKIKVNVGDSDLMSYDRTVFLPATEAAMPYLVEKLEALGFTGSLRDVGQLSGGFGNFYCKHETYQGVEREKWDVSHGGASKPLELRPPDASAMRRLDALYERARKGNSAAKPAPRPVAVPAASDDPTDNDVPW